MNKITKSILRVIVQCVPSGVSVGRIFKRTMGRRVLSGPFIGMRYVASSLGGAYYPRVLGTYELELGPAIEALCQKSFDTIINVGAGEGYYAVGLALRNPHAHIVAFEGNVEGQRLIKQMAEMNGVAQRLSIRGLCDAGLLLDCLSDSTKSLVVMDVEGSESAMLDPVIVPKLKESYILVELHDFLSEGVSASILKRFQDTHKITKILSQPRTFADFPVNISGVASLLPKRWLTKIMDEWRQEKMNWFYLKPNAW